MFAGLTGDFVGFVKVWLIYKYCNLTAGFCVKPQWFSGLKSDCRFLFKDTVVY